VSVAPDPDASVAFFGELFEWEATEPGPVEETGGYRPGIRMAGLPDPGEQGRTVSEQVIPELCSL
jgi:hypothetical protein